MLEVYGRATLLVVFISSILFFFVWLIFSNSPENMAILAAIFAPIISMNVIIDAFKRGSIHILLSCASAGLASVAAFFVVRLLIFISTSVGLHGGLFH